MYGIGFITRRTRVRRAAAPVVTSFVRCRCFNDLRLSDHLMFTLLCLFTLLYLSNHIELFRTKNLGNPKKVISFHGVKKKTQNLRARETMGSRSESEDQSTFDPHYSPPNTVDFATQEVADQITSQEAGVTRADGKQQGSRKRLISLVDDTDDSDVEISQPTQKTKPCRHTSFGTATRKPMLQSTIDGGVGSKGKSVPMKSVIRGGRRKSPTKSKKKKVSPTQSQKKKSQRTYRSLVMNWMKKRLMRMKSVKRKGKKL
ncbi:LOW QUALITY PROTEIN: hypothetical protein HID58_058118 [Brassica napus]|uniref:Uncharacterized protein n=1 Tax=Brassica napus TaxID=3708 RepID=A0ABQ7ZPP1_BRANA|nr:LOW QUALITY PROTEIN: hypothetical protein HID58_058118 [Brassica napus]